MDRKKEIIKKFRNILENEFIIIDTETTGLSALDEIIEIGILSKKGKVLMNQRINPTCHINFTAYQTHGISIQDLEKSPRFKDIYQDIKKLVKDSFVVGYNSIFDLSMLDNCCKKNKLELILSKDSFDVMKPYAIIWGEWNDYHQNYKWQKLTNACIQQKIKINNEHSAIGDCKLTLELMKKISKL
ncbi:MAG: 3'-5' exonuclease [Promethearchaeota archaeon]|nr:MAG: 3'-5' exonuclease [Candidatus Lokiarchaeota archaeon]